MHTKEIPLTNQAADRETRIWIAVIVAILLSEVGMHEFGHFPIWLGLLVTGFLAIVTYLALRTYGETNNLAWLLTGSVLALIILTVVSELLNLHLLDGIDLSGNPILGTAGPTHGLLGVTHLVSDVSVIGIGIYQLIRWNRLRNTTSALGAAAAFSACCGTTAVLLAPVFAAAATVLAGFGIHVSVSFVTMATFLTLVIAALALAWSGLSPRRSE